MLNVAKLFNMYFNAFRIVCQYDNAVNIHDSGQPEKGPEAGIEADPCVRAGPLRAQKQYRL